MVVGQVRCRSHRHPHHHTSATATGLFHADAIITVITIFTIVAIDTITPALPLLLLLSPLPFPLSVVIRRQDRRFVRCQFLFDCCLCP